MRIDGRGGGPSAQVDKKRYPTLFQTFVIQSVQTTLEDIDDNALFLREDERSRVFHILSFALKNDGAWPITHKLLLRIASKLEQAGNRDDWLAFLYQGVACSQRHDDLLASAELQWQIGHLYRLQSQFEPAREALDASAAAFKSLGDNSGQARAWNELGYLSWHQQHHADAQKFAEASLANLRDPTPERAISLSVLGLTAISLHRWQEAENYFQEALQIRTAQGDQQRIAWTLQHLGYALHSQEDFPAAIRYYEEAIQILAAIQDWRNCAIVQMSLGIVYSLMKQPNKALELYEVAESSFRKTYDSLHIAKVLANRGIDCLVLEKWQLAIDAFTNSALLYEELHDTYSRINALDGLGLANVGLGLHDKAITIFEMAVAQLPLIENHPMYPKLSKDVMAHLEEAKRR